MCMLLLLLQAQKEDHSSDSPGCCRRGSCLLLVSFKLFGGVEAGSLQLSVHRLT
jgi:hypothetical protein